MFFDVSRSGDEHGIVMVPNVSTMFFETATKGTENTSKWIAESSSNQFVGSLGELKMDCQGEIFITHASYHRILENMINVFQFCLKLTLTKNNFDLYAYAFR